MSKRLELSIQLNSQLSTARLCDSISVANWFVIASNLTDWLVFLEIILFLSLSALQSLFVIAHINLDMKIWENVERLNILSLEVFILFSSFQVVHFPFMGRLLIRKPKCFGASRGKKISTAARINICFGLSNQFEFLEFFGVEELEKFIVSWMFVSAC